MFPRNEHQNEGTTFGCSPRTKTGTRVRSHVPPGRKPERGHIRQNHPFTKPPFCLPVRSGRLFSADRWLALRLITIACSVEYDCHSWIHFAHAQWVAPKAIPDKAGHPKFPQIQSIEYAEHADHPQAGRKTLEKQQK